MWGSVGNGKIGAFPLCCLKKLLGSWLHSEQVTEGVLLLWSGSRTGRCDVPALP